VLTTAAGRFRVAAFAEAASWAGLLIAMLFKYSGTHDAAGVHVFGPIHGVIFIGYVVLAVAARGPLWWNARTMVWALVASIPPFGSVVFERWASRTGRLDEPPVTEKVTEPVG
jgi:integral membrane protein